jgi:hypothetical protein
MNDDRGRKRGAIGPWRLLDIARATMTMRSSMFGMSGALPQYGQPDEATPDIDPARELPDSYINEHERSQAVQRERARRFMANRG